MNLTREIILKKHKEESVKRKHHWIFSGAIHKYPEGIGNGEIVHVKSSSGEILGTGFFQHGSIMVRMLSFEKTEVDKIFWYRKLEQAVQLRLSYGYFNNDHINCCRLFFGEGDGIPGLVIDWYAGAAVIQAHTYGIHLHRKEIALALKSVIKDKLHTIYYKSDTTLHTKNEGDETSEYLMGNSASGEITEYGNRFNVNWEVGQKTGYFLDQKENRQLLKNLSAGKSVLDTFCHSGGFSVYALRGGALEVTAVDVSKHAITQAEQNLITNGFTGKYQLLTADVPKYLRENSNKYDIVVLDPPAFAKHKDARHNAIIAYKRLNADGLRHVKSGGFLFTFSCSQIVDKNLFSGAVMAAAIESGRNARIVHRLTQPADHPVNIFHPESEYLKGLVLYVE